MKQFILTLVVLALALFVPVSSSAEIHLGPIEGTIWEFTITDVIGIIPPIFKHLAPEERFSSFYAFLDGKIYIYRGDGIWEPFPQIPQVWSGYVGSFSIMHEHMKFVQSNGRTLLSWGTMFNFHSLGIAIEPMGLNFFLYLGIYQLKYYADAEYGTQTVVMGSDGMEVEIPPENFIYLPY